MRLDAHLSSARNPMFGPKVIVKYDITQLESCLSISPIPLFALDLAGNALCVYARGYSIFYFYAHAMMINKNVEELVENLPVMSVMVE